MKFQTRKKLNPGDPGTKKLVKKYGSSLISVRYKFDTETKTNIKTVELIEQVSVSETVKNKPVKIKIGYEEKELRKIIKEKGGVWNKEEKLWTLKYKDAVSLKLKGRIIEYIQ